MKNLDLEDDEVKFFLENASWNKFGITLTESGEAVIQSKLEEPKKEEVKVEETKGDHVCPLCESKLNAPLTDEKLEEHILTMTSILDEAYNKLSTDSESIEEKSETKDE